MQRFRLYGPHSFSKMLLRLEEYLLPTRDQTPNHPGHTDYTVLALLLIQNCVYILHAILVRNYSYIQGVTGGTDLMLNYTDITQNTYTQS